MARAPQQTRTRKAASRRLSLGITRKKPNAANLLRKWYKQLTNGMAKFKLAKMFDPKKLSILKSKVKDAIPKKLGRPRQISKVSAKEQSPKAVKDIMKSIKKAKSRLGKSTGRYKG